MTNILILGAAGHIATFARKDLLVNSDVHITNYLRRANRLENINPDRETVIEGDTTDQATLVHALENVDIVYANLAGSNIEQQAMTIVAAMKQQRVKRLIWISTLGIYDEVPGNFGEWNHSMLDGGYLQTYSAAAEVIESSSLDYTIIRPAWLTNKDEVDYELTQKGEPFKGTEVSRKSIGVLVSHLIQKPTDQLKKSLGVNKPNTDGDKPVWY